MHEAIVTNNAKSEIERLVSQSQILRISTVFSFVFGRFCDQNVFTQPERKAVITRISLLIIGKRSTTPSVLTQRQPFLDLSVRWNIVLTISTKGRYQIFAARLKNMAPPAVGN
ncbi:hypothetical protein C9426_12725 [Serratia sp. S1B]|nr:hypothetical protein C9426_12725 [Serratia sp. S1B]